MRKMSVFRNIPVCTLGQYTLGVEIKKGGISKLNPIVICPSHWIASQAQKSFLGDSAIHVIPLGLDLKIFLPIDKKV